MAKEKTQEKFDKTKRESLDLKEFMLLDAKAQDSKIEAILKSMYDNGIEINKKYIDKVLNISFDVGDNEVYLPHNLRVEKKASKLIFSFREKNNWALIIIFLLSFLFIGGAATYSGVYYLRLQEFNIDLDGDGTPDLNIDIGGNQICDVNCDINKDRKPDRNIDYKGNRKPTFNIEREDGTIFNPINQKDENGKCLLNCDTNDDGWPDINLDLDGDGKPDVNIDKDGDGTPDLNIDNDGDGEPDINIDEDGDGICDKKCAMVVTPNGNHGISVEGPGNVGTTTAALKVVFNAQNKVVTENLFPDDQAGQGVNTTVPDLKFTIENTTDKVLYYDLKWLVNENTFETDNFWYKVASDNNGYNSDWATAPKDDNIFKTHIAINPHTTQSYTVSMTLHGTGQEQNIDQGKSFKGQIEVLMEEQ